MAQPQKEVRWMGSMKESAGMYELPLKVSAQDRQHGRPFSETYVVATETEDLKRGIPYCEVALVDSTGTNHVYSLEDFVIVAGNIITHFAHQSITDKVPLPEIVENFLLNMGAFFQVAIRPNVRRERPPLATIIR